MQPETRMAERRRPSSCGLLDLFRGRKGSRAHRRSSSASSVASSTPARPSPRPLSGSDDYTAIVIRPANVPVVAKPALAPRPLPPSRAITGPVKPMPVKKPVPGSGISGELDGFLFDYQKSKGSSQLVRATSGNVMLYGNLGNLRPNRSSDKDSKSGYGSGAANSVTAKKKKSAEAAALPPMALCRTLSKREDPERLKEAGNEEFRKGRFAEALALYDRAIVLDPGKASYRSNRSAALAGMGRLLEAVAECKEAVRLDPNYCRAHNRLASLYVRLGVVEKAIDHYKLSQSEASPSEVSRAEALRSHLGKCSEARKLRDWQTILAESRSAVSLGANLSPKVIAWQAEALMMLHKQSEAEAVLRGGPKFDIDASTEVFGATVNGYVLMIQAQIDMATGRFDEAIAVAQKAAQVDPNSREIGALARRTREVASARSIGNGLFNSSKFQEACLAYSKGLDNDPHNTILLCNRAASRAKLGQWEKAVEDCSTALRFRPLYAKARIRRADCNAKLKRWKAAVEDYEILMKEVPGDKEVEKSLLEAKSQLQKKKKGDAARS